MRSPLARSRLRPLLTLTTVGILVASCDPQELAKQAGGARRISIATGGTGGVYYPYGGGIAKLVTEHLERVAATAEVTAASVDNMKLLAGERVDLAFTLADTLADAASGAGAFEEIGPVPARALAVLYRNYTHLVTLEGSGIDSLKSLTGRVVSTGSPGSGTEVIALRVLQAAGVDPERVRRQGLGAQGSVDALKDGKIDAFFWSGGLPTASILDLASTPRRTIRLLPNASVLQILQDAYGSELYVRVEIPADAYPGIETAVPVIGVANILAVHEGFPEELAYQITRLLFERRDELIAIHPEARNLGLTSAVDGSPVPFHPGAIRYYREREAWPR